MSIMINNRMMMSDEEKKKQAILRSIILELHAGKDPGEVKAKFAELINGVTAGEISRMEEGLINEGMAVEEIQRLCDIHADIFKGSIEEIHSITNEETKPGHPVRTIKDDNRAITELIDEGVLPKTRMFLKHRTALLKTSLLEELAQLLKIDQHYKIKENILFPYMEKLGISAPPKVMWGVDDEIRAGLKDLAAAVEREAYDEISAMAEPLMTRIKDMIFKEENIMLPMLTEKLTEDEWVDIVRDAEEIGYALVAPGVWKPARNQTEENVSAVSAGTINFETGSISLQTFETIMKLLPVDLTFIDQDDIVRFYTEGKRVFPRTKSVIGRTVQNCHPPKSVHVVEKILSDFKAGTKDSEEFWIDSRGMFIYIRYFAVRDPQGAYLGTLEVTQEVRGIRDLAGEKRLLSE